MKMKDWTPLAVGGAPIVRTSDRCEMRVALATPHVVVTNVSGYFESHMAAAMCDELAGVVSLRRGARKLLVFHDWSRMTGYDWEARLRLTEWMQPQSGIFETTHVLVGSRAIGMGVAVTSLLLGGVIASHTDPVSWERVLRAWVAADGGSEHRAHTTIEEVRGRRRTLDSAGPHPHAGGASCCPGPDGCEDSE